MQGDDVQLLLVTKATAKMGQDRCILNKTEKTYNGYDLVRSQTAIQVNGDEKETGQC